MAPKPPIIPVLALTIMSCQIQFFMYATLFIKSSFLVQDKEQCNRYCQLPQLLLTSVLENSTKLLARISVRLYIAWWQTPGSNPSLTITDWFWTGNVAVNPACHGFKTGQWASQRLVSWDVTRLSRHDLILKQACSSERVIWNYGSSSAHVSENKQWATLRRKMH
jgi:hypothetical protein